MELDILGTILIAKLGTGSLALHTRVCYWSSALLICLETGLMSLTKSVFSLHCETSSVAARWSSLWSMEHAQSLWDGSDFGRDLFDCLFP